MSDNEELGSTIDKLLADLEIEPDQKLGLSADLEPEFASLLNIAPALFLKVGLDIAVTIAFAGDWKLSHRFASRLLELNDDRWIIKLWQLRCLVELRRYAEALALSTSMRWPNELLMHVNYLTGAAFDGLDLSDQAQSRYRAVYDVDSAYRDVAQRLLNR